MGERDFRNVARGLENLAELTASITGNDDGGERGEELFLHGAILAGSEFGKSGK